MTNVSYGLLGRSSLGIGLVGFATFITSVSATSDVVSAEAQTEAAAAVVQAGSSSADTDSNRSTSMEAGETCTLSNRRDPLCPWGRLSDGHGKLVRCMLSDETHSVTQNSSRETAARSVPTRTETPSDVTAAVTSVVFEGESIASAKQNFASAVPDYQTCVANNGGLRHGAAEVRIRFHVDAHGLARDASVSRRRFISVQAARCISRVVTHHLVGPPKSKSTVGTLLIQFTK